MKKFLVLTLIVVLVASVIAANPPPARGLGWVRMNTRDNCRLGDVSFLAEKRGTRFISPAFSILLVHGPSKPLAWGKAGHLEVTRGWTVPLDFDLEKLTKQFKLDPVQVQIKAGNRSTVVSVPCQVSDQPEPTPTKIVTQPPIVPLPGEPTVPKTPTPIPVQPWTTRDRNPVIPTAPVADR